MLSLISMLVNSIQTAFEELNSSRETIKVYIQTNALGFFVFHHILPLLMSNFYNFDCTVLCWDKNKKYCA